MEEKTAEPEDPHSSRITTLATLTAHFLAISRELRFPATQRWTRRRMRLSALYQGTTLVVP